MRAPAKTLRYDDRGSGGVAVVGSAVVAIVAFGLLGYAAQLEGGPPPPPAIPAEREVTQEVTDVDEGAVSLEQFREVEVGVAKEELLQSLRPALPVDARTLERYEQRSPATIAAECVFYAPQQQEDEELLRFCFAQDQLVDKAVVLPEPEAS